MLDFLFFLSFFTLFFVVLVLSDIYISIEESIKARVHTAEKGSYGRWAASSC